MDATIDEARVDELVAAARAAAARAYAPYSRFPVGAAALMEDGAIVTGCNVENASYGLTVCAERVAIWTAVAAGHTAARAIAVVASRADWVAPCGACRQVLHEFAPRAGDLVVILTGSGRRELIPLSRLLPRAFGPADVATAGDSPPRADG